MDTWAIQQLSQRSLVIVLVMSWNLPANSPTFHNSSRALPPTVEERRRGDVFALHKYGAAAIRGDDGRLTQPDSSLARRTEKGGAGAGFRAIKPEGYPLE